MVLNPVLFANAGNEIWECHLTWVSSSINEKWYHVGVKIIILQSSFKILLNSWNNFICVVVGKCSITCEQ